LTGKKLKLPFKSLGLKLILSMIRIISYAQKTTWEMLCLKYELQQHRGPSSTVTVRVVESNAVRYLLMFSENLIHLPGSEKYKI